MTDDRTYAFVIGAVVATAVIWAGVAVIASVTDLEGETARRAIFSLLAALAVVLVVGGAINVDFPGGDRAFGYFLTAFWIAGLVWALVAVFSSVDDVDPEVAQRIGYGLLFGIPLLAGGIVAINRDAKEERLAAKTDRH